MRYLTKISAVFLLLLFGNSVFADPASHLFQQLSTIQSLQANFNQIIQSDSGQLLQKSTGRVSIRRPGYFRWQVDKPMAQVSTSDGKKVWVYEPDLAQVTIRPLDPSLAKAPFLLVAQKPQQLEQDYDVQHSKKAGIDWYQLTPKGNNSTFKKLLIGFDGRELTGIRLLNNLGQTTIINFNDVSMNPKLSKSLFKLSWPSNTDVVDMT